MEQQAAPSARGPPPPATILWELLAHINSLIVRTHSRLNDSLFVDEGIVDQEGRRGGQSVMTGSCVLRL